MFSVKQKLTSLAINFYSYLSFLANNQNVTSDSHGVTSVQLNISHPHHLMEKNVPQKTNTCMSPWVEKLKKETRGKIIIKQKLGTIRLLPSIDTKVLKITIRQPLYYCLPN